MLERKVIYYEDSSDFLEWGCESIGKGIWMAFARV